MEGYNCAQSVLYPYCDNVGLEKNIALKIACGFGGGMGCRGEICGAVAGGIIVVGTRYGRGDIDDRTIEKLAYIKTRELMDGFVDVHGTLMCRTLLNGCALMTKEGQLYFKENNLLENTCVPCI